MIVECDVWCILNPENEALGLKSGDSWMPFAVDFRSIIAIKKCGENEFLGDDRATIYFANESVTLDLSFEVALKIWKEAKL